jgi:DNA-binding MurR/RpiR family transcriptional regulator
MLREQINLKMQQLSAGQVEVARYILDNPRDAAFLTASQIGEKVGVSESTVIRLASALGFSGFPELRSSVQDLLMDHLSTLERYQNYGTGDNDDSLFETVIDEGLKTLSLARTQVDRSSLDSLSSAISGVDGLYIIGQRSSYSLAYYLSYYMSWLIPNTHLLDAHLANEKLSQAPENSLALAISFPRFSRWTLDILIFARERGVRTASITSDLNSPLAYHSDQVLAVPWKPLSFIDSFTAPLCMLNCVILSVSHKLGPQVDRRLKDLEEIWQETGAYVPV